MGQVASKKKCSVATITQALPFSKALWVSVCLISKFNTTRAQRQVLKINQ